jgi:regulator of sirC expression with transglutaminase-like and TPR domain
MDVFQGAMRIAREAYPGIDPERYRSMLDAFAARIGGRASVGRVNEVFFGELGFRGNADDYDDPRNCYLNEVLERRTGIPITLGAAWCEVARRAGLPARGICFPGHFLVRSGPVVVDCFHGRVLDREGCQALLDTVHGGEVLRLTDDMLAPSPDADILSRMLNNLRRIHAERREFGRVVRWIELDMELRPGEPRNWRDRGMTWVQLERFGKAVLDLEEYARRAPSASDLPAVREQLKLLGKLLSHLN